MRFSTGLLDWLFGEKITLELPNGQKRVVTKRWWAQMQQQGNVRPVAGGSAADHGAIVDMSPESLLKHGELIAITALTSLQQRLPAFQRVIARDGLDNWSFCFTVAFAYTAIEEPPADLSVRELDSFRGSVHSFIPKWHPDGAGALNNLAGFMDMGQGLRDDVALGMWLLWNLAGNRPTQDDEIQLARVLGSFIKAQVCGWWNLTHT